MKTYLKRTGLYYLYNTLAIFGGEMGAAIPVLILRAAFNTISYNTSSHLLTGFCSEICIAAIIFYLMQRDAYEKRQFSLKAIIPPALTVCAIRWIIWYTSKGTAAFWVTGGATSFSPVLFPSVSFQFSNTETVICDLISTIVCDLFITLPAFILGAYYGYKRRQREINQMVKEHQNSSP